MTHGPYRKRTSALQKAEDLKNKTINKLQGAGESVRNKVEETMEGVAPFARARGALDAVLDFDQRYADRVKSDMGGAEKRPMGVFTGGIIHERDICHTLSKQTLCRTNPG